MWLPLLTLSIGIMGFAVVGLDIPGLMDQGNIWIGRERERERERERKRERESQRDRGVREGGVRVGGAKLGNCNIIS